MYLHFCVINSRPCGKYCNYHGRTREEGHGEFVAIRMSFPRRRYRKFDNHPCVMQSPFQYPSAPGEGLHGRMNMQYFSTSGIICCTLQYAYVYVYTILLNKPDLSSPIAWLPYMHIFLLLATVCSCKARNRGLFAYKRTTIRLFILNPFEILIS